LAVRAPFRADAITFFRFFAIVSSYFRRFLRRPTLDASDIAMAMACFRDFTRGPEALPE
jgi:hypothetical protein